MHLLYTPGPHYRPNALGDFALFLCQYAHPLVVYFGLVAVTVGFIWVMAHWMNGDPLW